MDPNDIYISADRFSFEPAPEHDDESPFEPMAAEFLTHCSTILGARTLSLGIEDRLSDLRRIFERGLVDCEDAGERALRASMMLVALHDAIVTTIPTPCVAQILALVVHDERTKAAVTSCRGN